MSWFEVVMYHSKNPQWYYYDSFIFTS